MQAEMEKFWKVVLLKRKRNNASIKEEEENYEKR
jgi:hypothetical protein